MRLTLKLQLHSWTCSFATEEAFQTYPTNAALSLIDGLVAKEELIATIDMLVQL